MGRRKQNTNQSKGLKWVVACGVFLFVLVVGIQFIRSQNEANHVVLANYYQNLPQVNTMIGYDDAPVTVVEYFDFQCPACQNASDNIVQPIIEKYVANGDVQFIYRFFPILGPESVAAAQAAFCAMEQQSFWPYQDVLFAQRGRGNGGTYSQDNLIKYARQIGLDTEQFSSCLSSSRAEAYVQTSYEYAQEIGLKGTPSFTVNGQHVTASLQAVEQAIENILSGLDG